MKQMRPRTLLRFGSAVAVVLLAATTIFLVYLHRTNHFDAGVFGVSYWSGLAYSVPSAFIVGFVIWQAQVVAANHAMYEEYEREVATLQDKLRDDLDSPDVYGLGAALSTITHPIQKAAATLEGTPLDLWRERLSKRRLFLDAAAALRDAHSRFRRVARRLDSELEPAIDRAVKGIEAAAEAKRRKAREAMRGTDPFGHILSGIGVIPPYDPSLPSPREAQRRRTTRLFLATVLGRSEGDLKREYPPVTDDFWNQEMAIVQLVSQDELIAPLIEPFQETKGRLETAANQLSAVLGGEPSREQ